MMDCCECPYLAHDLGGDSYARRVCRQRGGVCRRPRLRDLPRGEDRVVPGRGDGTVDAPAATGGPHRGLPQRALLPPAVTESLRDGLEGRETDLSTLPGGRRRPASSTW